ncbi:MAG: hypothetical protein QOI25_4686 [Mycobacterium sp.]|jgi:hypothetical protein|nr:hypothetical protein [Mycobacterium sp.]MDT5324945.1 hypothetical protein [Mycobacterium sp.]
MHEPGTAEAEAYTAKQGEGKARLKDPSCGAPRLFG